MFHNKLLNTMWIACPSVTIRCYNCALMAALNNMKYLTKRPNSSNYYVRVPVPQDIQVKLGRKEVWRSLGTANRKEAEARVFRAVANIKDEFAGLQDGEATHDPQLFIPSDRQIEQAAVEVYHMLVEDDLEERAHDTQVFREFWTSDGHKSAIKRLQAAFAVGDYSEIDVEYWASLFGFDLAPETPAWRSFAQLLMRARMESARRAKDHDKGEIGNRPKDKLFRKGQVQKLAASNAVKNSKAAAEPGLLELFGKHSRHEASRLRPDTLAQRVKPVRRFVEFVGMDIPPSKITKAHAREWRDALREWPLKADQRKVFAGLDFNRIIERNKALGIPTISDRSLAKYVSEVSALFSWMVKEGYVEANVFDNLHIQPGSSKQLERTFSDEQLAKLFASALFTGSEGPDKRGIHKPGSCRVRDWRFWLPILAAFTGARQAELAQLEIKDIGTQEGVYYLRVTNSGEDPGKSVKNKFSVRTSHYIRN